MSRTHLESLSRGGGLTGPGGVHSGRHLRGAQVVGGLASSSSLQPRSLPSACCLQMHKVLDIDISDEASSTVIHVRAPISARLCDVSGVFDKLGE